MIGLNLSQVARLQGSHHDSLSAVTGSSRRPNSARGLMFSERENNLENDAEKNLAKTRHLAQHRQGCQYFHLPKGVYLNTVKHQNRMCRVFSVAVVTWWRTIASGVYPPWSKRSSESETILDQCEGSQGKKCQIRWNYHQQEKLLCTKQLWKIGFYFFN